MKELVTAHISHGTKRTVQKVSWVSCRKVPWKARSWGLEQGTRSGPGLSPTYLKDLVLAKAMSSTTVLAESTCRGVGLGKRFHPQEAPSRPAGGRAVS